MQENVKTEIKTAGACGHGSQGNVQQLHGLRGDVQKLHGLHVDVQHIFLRNLTGGYEGNPVLDIESLDFVPGELVSIIGCNGSGKSTLIKTIMGLLPYEGSLVIAGDGDRAGVGIDGHIDGGDHAGVGTRNETRSGVETRDLAPKQRARVVAYLPQILTPANLDVRTLVCHGRFAHLSHARALGRRDFEAVEEAMELTDVQDLQDKSLRDISGGERQRAYLAMIIAQQTPFLLLDEPTTYMDVTHQIRMLEILTKLRNEGRGVILTSHDLPQSATFSDRMILMQKGRVTAQGKPESFCGGSAGPGGNGAALQAAMQVGIKALPEGEYLYRYELYRA